MPDISTQSESIDLKGTCTSVAADGSTTWSFSVEHVALDTTVQSGGHLKFDSARDKECPQGFVRYAAIKGVTFTATVSADGTIQSCSLEDWPRTCDIKIAKCTTVKDSAANLFHDPTSPRVWLDLIFHTAPGKGKEWKRTLNVGNGEELDVRMDGAETVSGDACVRMKMETADQPKDAPNRIPREAFKSGKVSWSKTAGCALKADLRGGVVADKCVLGVAAQAKWELVCLKKGFDAEAAKGATPPAK
jgi:hypothetical protein